MRPLMAAEPMLRTPSPEITPESATTSSACNTAGMFAPRTHAPASARNRNRMMFSPELLGGGSGGLWRREPEYVAVGHGVDLRFVNLDLLLVARALLARDLREGEVHAVDLLVVAEVGDGLPRHTVLDAAVDGADLEEVIGVEVDVADVAVRPRDADLVRIGAVDVLGAEILELVALGLVVDEGAGEVGGILGELLGVVGGHLLGVLAALEGVDLPALRTVVGLHQREALERPLEADRARTLHQSDVAELQGVAVDQHLAGEAQRLDGVEPFGSALGRYVLGGELIGGVGVSLECCKQQR